MTQIYQDYNSFHYGIDAFSKPAEQYYPLEKTAKIFYRAIDLTNIVITQLSAPLILLSSQIKDLVLVIESTRFFIVAFPVLFGDKSGKSFFEGKSVVQCFERLSITFHLGLKTLFGAECVGLIKLGIISTFSIGHMTVFKMMLEGTILMYNFFGVWDGSDKLVQANQKLELIQMKIDKWKGRQNNINEVFGQRLDDREETVRESNKTEDKLRKWESIQTKLQFDKTNACYKIAATLSKFILIGFAVTLAMTNIWNVSCHVAILILGIISDGIGLKGYYFQEYDFPPSIA